ncbi:MAG: tRNA lysidine(34) synthetase TilS [Hyphomonas sp.]
MRQLTPQGRLDAVLSAQAVIPSEGPVGLAVSGGSDSLALLHLTHNWAAPRGVRLLVLTVDHRLRAEAAGEAQAVCAIARALGHDHQTLAWAAPQARQSAARRARHALLARALRGAGGRLLLTGHTACDQAETVLMRIRQGSGWYGLAGMREVSLSPVWPEGQGIRIVRPLIGETRAGLRDGLLALGQAWFDDPSNDNLAFERIRMRRLLGRLPGLQARILALQKGFAVLRAIEERALACWLEASVRLDTGQVLADFSTLPPERAARALGLLVQCVSGRETAPRSEALAALASRILCPEGFAGATLGGVRLRPVRGRIALSAEAVRITKPPGEAEIAARLTAFRAVFLNLTQDFAAGSGKESFLREEAPILKKEFPLLCENRDECP